MRKLYLLSLLLPLWTLLPLWGPGGRLFAAVQVQNISTDYANKQVTFNLSWAAGTRNATHNAKVWVLVDYQEVTNPNTTGAWQRATVVSATATNGTVSGNTGRGFYLQGADGAFSSTVTVTLSGVPAKFNWCATATDYPPNAVLSNGTYTLKGTTPFTINGSTSVSARTYTGACITAITDPTGCPGIVTNPAFSTGTIASTGQTLCVGGTPSNIGSYAAATGGDNRITYQWYKNGAVITGATATTYTPPTSDAAATASHTYTRRAKDATCNTTLTNSAGSWVLTVHRTCGNGVTIAGCLSTNISFTSGFVSSQTWVVGSQTWSAPVTATYCNKATYSSPTSAPYAVDCRTNSTAGYGHLFSWCMVAKFATTICPSGWRVPTSTDFCNLDKALRGLTTCTNRTDATQRNKYLNTWGGQYSGYCLYNGSLGGQGVDAAYWQQTEYNTDYGNYLYFDINGYAAPQSNLNKYFGATLRCVK